MTWQRVRRGFILASASYGLLVLLVTFTPFVGWYARLLAGDWYGPKGDTLIVLAGSDLDGFPNVNTVLRCMYAVQAYRSFPYRKIVVTGRGVSAHMRNLLIAEGLPPQIIVSEDRSTSTRENALFTRQLLADDPGSKILLTSDFHMFRAYRAFRKAGMQVTPSPIPDILKRNEDFGPRWEAFGEEIIETIKIVYYCSRGWI
jgi:uncharacterized SAM-binding protein YcdF (DUF218 family)